MPKATPLAFIGAAPWADDSRRGRLWFVVLAAFDGNDADLKSVMRLTVGEMLQVFGQLENHVSTEKAWALDLMRDAGFTVDPTPCRRWRPPVPCLDRCGRRGHFPGGAERLQLIHAVTLATHWRGNLDHRGGAADVTRSRDYVLIVGWSSAGEPASDISAAGYVAMGLGIVVTLALGIGLMPLIFYSNRRL